LDLEAVLKALFLGHAGNGYVALLHPDRSAQERNVAFAFLNF
jgi:hypothetical protein